MLDTVLAGLAMLEQLTVPIVILGAALAIWLVGWPLTSWFIRKNGPLSGM